MANDKDKDIDAMAAGNVDQAAEGSKPAEEKKKKPLKPPTPEEIAKIVADDLNEKVTVTFPLLLGKKKEEQTFFLQINGRNKMIERGKPVSIPKAYLDVYENMVRQDMLLAEYNAECLKQAEQI